LFASDLFSMSVFASNTMYGVMFAGVCISHDAS